MSFVSRQGSEAASREWGVASYLLLVATYVISGKLGLMLALPPGYASPIFPPAGIAVAAALIGSRKTLPWIFVGSLLLNIWVAYSTSQKIIGMGLIVALIIATASMLQAAIGGWGLRRVIGYPVPLDQANGIMRFLLLAPVICLISATVSVGALSVLGIFESANFVANWAAWWVGDTLGLLVMLPLVMIVAGEPRGLWLSRKYSVAIPMLVLLAIFVIGFLKTNQWENTASLSDFRQLSQQTLNQVHNRLGEQETVLAEMTALFVHDAKGRVSRDEFHRFIKKSLTRFPEIQALEWALPIDSAHRLSYEKMQHGYFPNFEIRERNTLGQLVRADERVLFYPVTFVEPLEGNEPAVGFDLFSNDSRREALNKAIASGNLVATGAVHLVQDRHQQDGLLLLLAVDSNDVKSGIVLSVLKLNDFMGKLLLDTHPMLYTRLIDIDEQKNVYDNFEPNAPPALFDQDFDFGMRHYRLETAPTPLYLNQHHGWESWSVLAAGMLGTSLFGALLLMGTGYTKRMEAQVEERTRRLKESELRFQNILDNAPIGMATTTIEGEFIQVNNALCAILGYAKSELEKLTFRDITHPEDMQITLASRQQLHDVSIKSYQMEKRYLRKDGQVVWAQVSASVARDEAGTPLYYIGQIEDVTKRKLAEIALRASEEKLRGLFELSPLGIALTDMEGRFIEFNKAFQYISGYSEKELMALDYWKLTPRKYEADEARQIESLQQTGHYGPYEKEYIHKNGSLVPLQLNGLMIDGYDGNKYIWSIVEDISKRKLAEKELWTKQLLLESIIENIPNMIFLKNASDLRFELLNKAGESLIGYTRNDVIGRNDYDSFPEDQADFFTRKDRDVLNQDGVVDISEEFIKTHRGIRILHTKKLPLLDEQGQPQYLLGISEDITERKQAEKLLQKSTAEIEDLYNHAPCGYHSLDKDAVIERINQTELDWLGYTHEEIAHKKFTELLSPESLLAFQKVFTLGKKRGSINEFEVDLVRKDGTTLHGLVNSTVVYDADGEYLLSRYTVFDITERKKADETLRALFTALEHSPIAVIITDANTNIQYVSPRFSEITGYSPVDIIGRNLRILQSGRITKFTYLEMWNVLASGRSWHGELLNKGKQGHVYWEDVHITPVKNPAGTVVSYVVVSSDITERKAIEDKMRHLAHYDPLTDLPNRSLVDDRLRQAHTAAKRDKNHMALMFIDLDKFKPINDTLGHDVGDMVLKSAAKRMQECVRESDTIGRVGGDEFVVLLPTVDSVEDAVLVAEKIRHSLNQPFNLAGQSLSISSSIGIAMYPDHASDEKTLVKNADTAMYYAKEAGRNNVQVFRNPMPNNGE